MILFVLPHEAKAV